MFWRRTRFITDGLTVRTRGLFRRAHPELRIAVNDPSLRAGAKGFLRFVVRCLGESGRSIRAGETLRYGYWLVKFAAAEGESGMLDVVELDPNATAFVPGGSLSVRYWEEQHRVCRRYNALFAPPDPDTLTAVSAGVREGKPVQGMRYPWPAHMSGWVIVTDEYHGDVTALVNEHTYHLTTARPDLAAYIALPPGFGFDLRGRARVTYDEALLQEHLREYFGNKAVGEAGFPKRR